MVRVKMSPDIEFSMEVELEGIDADSRDHDVQLHKADVYAAFMERLKKAFPEGDFKVDAFSFGLDTTQKEEGAA
jgi:hypothetical protein